MEKSTENNNKNSFLKEGFTDDISKKHTSYLGTEVPKDYFSKSKSAILNKIASENAQSKFLKEDISDINTHHKNYLGTAIPENYFIKSKLSILDKIKLETTVEEEQPKKQMVFYMRPQFKYIAAASLIFMLSVSIWLQSANTQNDLDAVDSELYALEDDVLINSLLVDESEFDAFADATLFNEIVVKAEMKEQKIDDLILNSLIVEDSLLDDYISDELIETIIL